MYMNVGREGAESSHRKVCRMWDTRETGDENLYYSKELINCLISYAYQIEWNNMVW